MKKLKILLLLVAISFLGCGKNESQLNETSQARKTDRIHEVPPESEIGPNVAYSNLTELQQIEPNVYWCYYGGVSLKFSNLIYNITNPNIPTLYADLFWTDKQNNVTVVEGSNFSTYFVLDESYCASPITVNYSYQTETVPVSFLYSDMNKIKLYYNGVPVASNQVAFDLTVGNSTTIRRVNSYMFNNNTITFGYYTFSIGSSLCGNWEVRRIIGKLFTQVVGGVRKYYVAPMNYPDPVILNGGPE